MGRGRWRPRYQALFLGLACLVFLLLYAKKSILNNDNNNYNDPLGLNDREARLADRMRDMEDQNQILRRQLSFSQNKLLSVHCKNYKKDENASLCDSIHVAIVCVGYGSSRTVITLIKSILFYRKRRLHFHFLTDKETKNVLETLFVTWSVPRVVVHFILIDDIINDVNWIPNKHYSGIYGLLKLTLPKVIRVKKVIVLDTDVTFAADISDLWDLFETFTKDQSIGVVENQSDWYLPGKLWKTHMPWPALGRGFNTGVILLDLTKLRDFDWNMKWRLTAERDLITFYKVTLADQDIFNSVIKSYPKLVYKIPCHWNIQLSDHSRFSEFCGDRRIKVIHFNSPQKQKFLIRHDEKEEEGLSSYIKFFQSHFLTFSQYDGNLLRHRDLNSCDIDDGNEVKNLNDKTRSSCLRFSRTEYRTHLYFMDFHLDYNNDTDITLVTQLSMDRLHMIETLCTQWSGPISLALYLSDAEAHEFVSFLVQSRILSDRKNIGYHVIYKEGVYYPINYLRNVALREARTEFVFLSDIDFLPGINTYPILRHALITKRPKTAFVIPAFETQRYRLNDFPKTKAQVLHLLDEGTLLTFRYHIWTKGHAPTDYAKWRTATTPYKIKWEEDFEPYIAARKADLPSYDTRFVGFGWNKVSHIMEMAALEYEFVVLPNVFMIHMPHTPSLDIAKFRSSETYRRCLKSLKREFIQSINQKYHKSFRIN